MFWHSCCCFAGSRSVNGSLFLNSLLLLQRRELSNSASVAQRLLHFGGTFFRVFCWWHSKFRLKAELLAIETEKEVMQNFDYLLQQLLLFSDYLLRWWGKSASETQQKMVQVKLRKYVCCALPHTQKKFARSLVNLLSQTNILVDCW